MRSLTNTQAPIAASTSTLARNDNSLPTNTTGRSSIRVIPTYQRLTLTFPSVRSPQVRRNVGLSASASRIASAAGLRRDRPRRPAFATSRMVLMFRAMPCEPPLRQRGDPGAPWGMRIWWGSSMSELHWRTQEGRRPAHPHRRWRRQHAHQNMLTPGGAKQPSDGQQARFVNRSTRRIEPFESELSQDPSRRVWQTGSCQAKTAPHRILIDGVSFQYRSFAGNRRPQPR